MYVDYLKYIVFIFAECRGWARDREWKREDECEIDKHLQKLVVLLPCNTLNLSCFYWLFRLEHFRMLLH